MGSVFAEHRDAVAAAVLGGVHGAVGVEQQALVVAAVLAFCTKAPKPAAAKSA